MIPLNFMSNIRVMIHTLTDHISAFFPDPWEKAIALEDETEGLTASVELMELANDLEQVWGHTQKLSHQIHRSYELLRTGGL